MSRIGFCGASYSSVSQNADAQTCRNFVLEKVESDLGKGPFLLTDREGMFNFCNVAGDAVRGIFWADVSDPGRCFAVIDSVLYEISTAGVATPLLGVSNDNLPVTWALNATATQVAVCSGGIIYVITLATTTVAAVPPATFSQGPVAMIEWCDDFCIALIANSNIFFNSAPDDLSSWPGANANQVSVQVGNIRSIKADGRKLALLGRSRGIAYYNTGAATTPFSPIPGGDVQSGIGATFSMMLLDNTWFWLDQDERGAGIFRKFQSGSAIRLSNHAIETHWASFSRIDDCIGFPYQNNGHSFAVLYFPTANETWAYDVATGLWAERDFWDAGSGTSTAYRARCHSYAFGKHLVGDWNSGNIYQLANTVQTDFGNPIRRVRRAPYVSVENERIYHASLELEMDRGVGPIPALTDGLGNNRGPQVVLRWSDNGGRTWSNEYARDYGQAGKYGARVIWRRLGQSRGRVYEVACTDPTPCRIVDAYLKASGLATQKRMVKELAEKA